MNVEDIRTKEASLCEIFDLRHHVLRAGMPVEDAKFPGDNDETTLHFAANAGERRDIVGCVSFFFSSWGELPAWQLRGMATDEAYRGMGVGTVLLQCAEKELRRLDWSQVMWCNARLPAVRFYEKMGWRTVSDVFEIPTAGPHRQMYKELG